MTRRYDFDLPYEVSSWYVSMGVSTLRSDGILDALPSGLRSRIEHAYEAGESVTITRADCDSIDDDTWTKLASLLRLRWETE